MLSLFLSLSLPHPHTHTHIPLAGSTMNSLVEYSSSHDIQGVLSYYLKKVVQDKPEDVVAYLQEKITEEPWVRESGDAQDAQTQS